MIKEIATIKNSIFEKLNLTISYLVQDVECDEYFGYNFKLDQFNIKFRKAKITPKKIGQFVTLWRRNPETKETEPFRLNDDFNFYIIYTEYENNQGFFLFSKKVLSQHQILTTEVKEGKRGFRVYSRWDAPENKQAVKTQLWQTKFFVNFSDDNYMEKFRDILNNSF